jgi:hypothetical protein
MIGEAPNELDFTGKSRLKEGKYCHVLLLISRSSVWERVKRKYMEAQGMHKAFHQRMGHLGVHILFGRFGGWSGCNLLEIPIPLLVVSVDDCGGASGLLSIYSYVITQAVRLGL